MNQLRPGAPMPEHYASVLTPSFSHLHLHAKHVTFSQCDSRSTNDHQIFTQSIEQTVGTTDVFASSCTAPATPFTSIPAIKANLDHHVSCEIHLLIHLQVVSETKAEDTLCVFKTSYNDTFMGRSLWNCVEIFGHIEINFYDSLMQFKMSGCRSDSRQPHSVAIDI